ncbi:hypothetical protein V5O48_013648 [Marasmius crinis-equi]|uniref:MYND-type domain-containing protein n=1 Tax=Marasmius crinis-equi TaxID=585013 RepID=A0ABR3EZI0_9AGAR
MSESLQVALRDATIGEPRARLGGLPDSEIEKLQSRLPSLAEVRNEVPKALKTLREPPPNDMQGVDQDGEFLGILHPSIAYHLLLPKLYAFSYFCHEEDVPENLQLLCLWALQQKVIALTEGSDKQLRRILATPQGEVLPGAKRFMEGQSRSKIIFYLLSPQINRPEEAIPHMEACMKLDEISKPLPNDVFLRNPHSYLIYGSVLARTKTRNAEARTVLERILKDIDKVTGSESKVMFIQAKLYLSRVLRGMGEVEAAKKHETYLITWFKKNPRRMPETTLRDLFGTESDADPVFQGLGGTSWLAKRKPTFKNLDRQARQCYNCGARESASTKLMRCAKCQYTYYWFVALFLAFLRRRLTGCSSRKCQVENHPFHKVGCAERASERKRAETLKATAPDDAKCMEDWNHYKNSGFDDLPSYHALGLMHDVDRGKTHIIFKSVEYVPQGGKDVLDRFKVVAAGVFKIKDVLREIEIMLNYNKGEGEEVIEEMLGEFNNGPGKGGRVHPFFNFFISNDKRLGTYLSIGGVGLPKLREIKYDPDWRKLLNRKKCHVEQMLLRSGGKDAERDYTPSDAQKHEPVAEVIESKSLQPREGQKASPRAESAVALPGLRGMFK